MSVEQSGQPWLYEPGTTDPLYEPEFDAFGDRSLITPPIEPALAAPAYETPGRYHTPSWAHEPYTEVEAFTAPIHTLEPAFGEPLYAQVLTERNPAIKAGQAARPTHQSTATGIHVMSLQDRGPLVKEGEHGSIFDIMNRERTASKKSSYAELRRPYIASDSSLELETIPPQSAPTPARREAIALPPAEEVQEIAAITPVKAIEPEATRTFITVKGEQEGSIAAVIEEERSGLDEQEAAAFLTRVLQGLKKSRDADLATEVAETAQATRAEAEVQAYAEKTARETRAEVEAKAEAERVAAEEQLAHDAVVIEAAAPQAVEIETETASSSEQTPTTVHEEHLTLSGIRAAAKEAISNHKKAARIAEYAGVAVVAVAAGARLLGRFRRR